MNHKGLTLIELIGSIVILSIAATLLAMILRFVVVANQETALNNSANLQGLLLVRTIENDMIDFEPNTYALTDLNEVILTKEYNYVLDPNTNEIVLDLYNPVLTYEVLIDQNNLYINDILYDLDGFQISNLSTIDFYESNQVLYIDMFLQLETIDHVYTYDFYLSYSYQLSTVPA